MKKLFYYLFCVLIIELNWLGNASADMLNFEDLYPGSEGYGTLVSNYGGFSWNANARWITKDYLVGSGYQSGTIDKVSILTSSSQSVSMAQATTFDFNGAYITSAWNYDHQVTVEGWYNGSKIYTTEIVTASDKPYWWDFNFEDIDTVWFKPGTGTNAGLGSTGYQIDIDNITYNNPINVVPEPISFLLYGLGGLTLGAARKFRKKK